MMRLRMPRGRAVLLMRVTVLAGAVLLLEALCRAGVIDPLTVIPPSAMAASMMEQILSGQVTDSILRTFLTVLAAFASAVALGIGIGALAHALPRLRRAIEPLLASYYSVPTFIFYPLLVALLGLSMVPLVVLGILSATPAMIIGTLMLG